MVRLRSQEFSCVYNPRSLVEILAKNFNLGDHGKIPSVVLLEAEAYLEKQGRNIPVTFSGCLGVEGEHKSSWGGM